MIQIQTREQLPENISLAVSQGNVFYSDNFEKYNVKSSSETFFAYNDDYAAVVTVHSIHKLFTAASFPSEPISLSETDSFDRQQSFLDEVAAQLKQNYGVDWITVTPASSLFGAYPTHSERIGFGNYVIDLTQDEESLFANVTSKHRNMIRRGERGEIVVKYGGVELLPDYITVDKQTWKRSGSDIDHTAYYTEYVNTLKDNAVVGVAYKDGVPQCGLIGCYNQRMFYYMFGASADRPEPGSTHLLQWQTILRMKAAGVQAYNFVGCRLDVDPGSKYENIQHFKKGFGGVLRECYLFRMTLNKTKKRLFDWTMKLKTGKAPCDVIDQEMHKWVELNRQ